MTVSNIAPPASSVPVPTASVRTTRAASRHIQKQQEGMSLGSASRRIAGPGLNLSKGMESVPDHDTKLAAAENVVKNQKDDATVEKQQR